MVRFDVRGALLLTLACTLSRTALADAPPPAPLPAAPLPAAPLPAGTRSATVVDWAITMERSRTHALPARSRASRIAEVEARRVDAERYPRQNPGLDVGAGPRFEGVDPRSAVFSVGLSQAFELGAAPSARQRRVDADRASLEANVEVETREAQRRAAIAFARGLWADARVDLARRSETMADEALLAIQKRKDAGDVSTLQINVARATRARAAAATRELEAIREAELGQLRYLLGLPPGAEVTLAGSIADPVPRRNEGETTAIRPEIAAIDADVRAAQADEDVADASGAPIISVGARYELEDQRIHTLVGTFGITLPIFERGQGEAAEARGRVERRTVERATTSERIAHEVVTRRNVLARHVAASKAFGDLGGTSVMQQNVELANRGFAAGEMSLGDLLLYRRELVETEVEHLDQLLELRVAEIEALAASGGLR